MTALREPNSPPAAAVDSRSPFVRLTELIAGIEPGKPAINLSVGEPQHPIPAFVGPTIAAHLNEFGRYPANKGSEPFRRAVACWLGRRYKLPRPVDPEHEVLVLSGTREGLFLAAIAALRWVPRRAGKPVVLIPNPFYAAYSAGALAAGCEPVYMPTTRESGFLPDLDALDDALLARTVALYIASPSNPQGAVASRAYLDRLAGLARRFGFLVFADECYCEIYSKFRQHRRLPLAVEALEPTGSARRFRRRRPALSRRLPRIAQCLGAAGTGTRATRRRRGLWRRDPCAGKPQTLFGQVRPRRSDHRRPLRLQTPGRRIFSLA
jgi:aspartate/methionine/tyrosine aminotransferase